MFSGTVFRLSGETMNEVSRQTVHQSPDFFRVKAFTKRVNAGSEASVLLNAANLSDGECQAIATDLGAATTAFCSAREEGFDIRFFTPRAASSICIHALVASAHVLWQQGRISVSRPVTFYAANDDYQALIADDGRVSVRVPDPVVGERLNDLSALSKALGCSVDDIGPTPVQIAGTGKAKLLVPVKSLKKLHQLDVDAAALRRVCIDVGAEGVFLFTAESFETDADFHARHFNPLTLDSEDPICGIGSGALAAYLDHFDMIERPSFGVEQGVSTGNPGVVYLDTGECITVGGYAVIFSQSDSATPPGINKDKLSEDQQNQLTGATGHTT